MLIFSWVTAVWILDVVISTIRGVIPESTNDVPAITGFLSKSRTMPAAGSRTPAMTDILVRAGIVTRPLSSGPCTRNPFTVASWKALTIYVVFLKTN